MGGREVFAIVGGGQAGAWAAKTLRSQGFVGRVVLFSEEAHPPYERPPLSKQVLLGEAPPESARVFAASVYEESRIELRLGTRVDRLDAQAHELRFADGSAMRYDRLLLATGAKPRRLESARGSNVFYLRSLEDSAAIGARLSETARVLVIGGGWIGLEIAAAARKRGAAVTVVEALSRLCSRAAPQDLSDELLALHRARGVEVRLDTVVTAFEGDAEIERVVLSSGDVLEVSVIVVGIGIAPCTELAASAGLEIENGIAVDSTMCTSARDVFAAGDVASCRAADGKRRRLESWDNAQKQGIAAARAMLGLEVTLDAFPWFWSDQFGENVQLIGEFSEYDERLQVATSGSGGRLGLYLSRGAVVGAVGLNAGRDIRLIKRSLDGRQPLPAGMMENAGRVSTVGA